MEQEGLKLMAEGKQAEILTNEPTYITIGDKEYAITALVPNTQWKISLLINKMQKAESSIEGILGAMGTNIPVLAEIIALAIINDETRFKAELEELKHELLMSQDYHQWFDIVRIIFEKLDFGFFFLITKQIEQLSTMARKMTKEEQQ